VRAKSMQNKQLEYLYREFLWMNYCFKDEKNGWLSRLIFRLEQVVVGEGDAIIDGRKYTMEK
jgi:hypothetical protein